jgi:hypothetical protein
MTIKSEFSNVEWLLNRLGEECEEGKTIIPDDVRAWYNKLEISAEEDGYLVRLDQQYGYMIVHEYMHNEVDLPEEREIAAQKQMTREKALDYVTKIADQVNRQSASLDIDYDITVSDAIGAAGRHELCVFLRFDRTNNEDLLRARLFIARAKQFVDASFIWSDAALKGIMEKINSELYARGSVIRVRTHEIVPGACVVGLDQDAFIIDHVTLPVSPKFKDFVSSVYAAEGYDVEFNGSLSRYWVSKKETTVSV